VEAGRLRYGEQTWLDTLVTLDTPTVSHFVRTYDIKAYAAPILVSRSSQAATMLAVSRQFGSKRTL
jgi:hypothetical protein